MAKFFWLGTKHGHGTQELCENQRPIKPQNLAVNLGPCRTKSYGHSSPAFAPCLQLQPCCAAQGSQAWRAEPSGAAAAAVRQSPPQCRAATA